LRLLFFHQASIFRQNRPPACQNRPPACKLRRAVFCARPAGERPPKSARADGPARRFGWRRTRNVHWLSRRPLDAGARRNRRALAEGSAAGTIPAPDIPRRWPRHPSCRSTQQVKPRAP